MYMSAAQTKAPVQKRSVPKIEWLTSYLERLNRWVRAPRRAPPLSPPLVHLSDVAALEVGRPLGQPPPVSPDEALAIEALTATSGFRDAVRRAGTLADVRHFETETGLTVLGASIIDAVASNGAHLVILAPGNGNTPGVVRIEPNGACSIALRFDDGRGTALAVLRSFVAHVIVDSDGVGSVSYVCRRIPRCTGVIMVDAATASINCERP
jgi:hypothetical protein